MTSRPRRLHVAAVGAEAVSQLRQIALPLIVLAVVGSRGGTDSIGYAAIAVLVAIGFAWLQWSSTRWYIDEDAVRLRRGVLSENVVTIPFDRVQAIDTVRGPIQRLFGVVEVHVQSAGGGRAGEIVLKAVTPQEADELRAAVRAGTAGAQPGAPVDALSPAPHDLDAPERPVPALTLEPAEPTATWRLGTRPLLLAALTSGSVGVLLPVVAGASQFADDLLGADEAQSLLPDTIQGALVLAAVILGVAWVLSFLGTVIAFAGFEASREGERLRIRRGVLERRESSVPVARVHAVRIIESPLREPFGLAQVRIETAGYASEAATAQTLLPLVRREHARAVLRDLLPELDAPLDDLAPLPRRALRRYVVGPVVIAAAIAAAAITLLGRPALPALVLVPLAIAIGIAWHRTAGWRLEDDRLVLRTRIVARTTATADARRLQAVRVSANPLQRRARLSTLSVSVSSGRRLTIEELDDAVATDLFARLGATATRGT